MWHLTALSSLMLMGYCIGAPQLLIDDGSDAYVQEQIRSIFGTNPEIHEDPATSTPNPRNVRDSAKGGEDTQSNENNSGDAVVNDKNPNNADSVDGCVCVPYYQCRNGTIVDDGAQIFDVKSAPQSEKASRRSVRDVKPCSKLSDVCCKPPEIVRTKRHDGCGRRGSGEKFPWMAAVIQKIPTEKYSHVKFFRCGGSLIHPQAVLTTASCILGTEIEQLIIRVGQSDTGSEDKAYPYQERNISKVIPEKFNVFSFFDIVILFLSSPVELTENVDVACLPRQNDRYDTSRCLSSARGDDVMDEEGEIHQKFKSIEFSIIPHSTCEDKLRETRIGSEYLLLSPRFICARSNDRNECRGAEGNPLICPLLDEPSRYVQAGVLSGSAGCGEYDFPGTYADIQAAREWIERNLNLNTASS